MRGVTFIPSLEIGCGRKNFTCKGNECLKPPDVDLSPIVQKGRGWLGFTLDDELQSPHLGIDRFVELFENGKRAAEKRRFHCLILPCVLVHRGGSWVQFLEGSELQDGGGGAKKHR